MQNQHARPSHPGPKPGSKGSPLRQLRLAAGLSVRELARLIGQDHSNVRYWERQGKPPRSDVLVPLAKVLGVTVAELLDEGRPQREAPPARRLRQLFEAAARLPRRQQEHLVAMLAPFIREHARKR